MPIFLDTSQLITTATPAGPSWTNISFNVYDFNTSPIQLLDLTNQNWAKGNVYLSIRGMGDRVGLNDVIFRSVTSTLVDNGNIILSKTSPNVQVVINANFPSDITFGTFPLTNFPPGEYIFEFYLQNLATSQQATYRDILYIMGGSSA